MKKKILIVDDKVDSCDVLRDILTDDGYDTSASLSSRSALARIKKKKPDLVLLDIKMPGMDGIELLKRVKQRDKKIAVVMITAHADVDTAREAMKLGAFDYITKPYIGIEDKTQKIHQILHENALIPGQTLFVGDMEHDIEAGKAGGVHTCAVLTGYNHVEKLRAMSPDLICEHLGELQRTLVERDHADAQRQQRPSRGIGGPDSVRNDGEPKKQRAGP